MMPAENGFILPCCSQVMLCGTRSLRAMVVPSGRHIKTASSRSSAVILAR